jgi:hypothetical protein
MTTPEQPTPELDDLDALVQDLRDCGDEWSWDETRQRISRFAAQRAAEAVAALHCAACDGPYPNPDCGHLRNARDMRERAPCRPAQPAATPPPGDAGERARNHPDDCLPDCMMPDGGEACEGYQHTRKLLADAQTKIAAIQSERTAAASKVREAMSRAQQAGIDNLRECGAAFRMIRDALAELSGAVPPIRERDVGPPDYTADAEEIIDGFRRALTVAASQARRESLPADWALAWALMEARNVPERARGDSDVQAAAVTEAQAILRALGTPQARKETGRDDDAV